MANTCEGSLRIRGPKDNIQRFLLNGLEPHNSTKKLEIKDGDILFFGYEFLRVVFLDFGKLSSFLYA